LRILCNEHLHISLWIGSTFLTLVYKCILKLSDKAEICPSCIIIKQKGKIQG